MHPKRSEPALLAAELARWSSGAPALAELRVLWYGRAMLNWLRTLLSRAPASGPTETRPSWADELLEGVHKQSRATVKQSARLEAALAEQAALITQLSHKLERAAASEREPDVRSLALQFAPLFDALDALDEAARLATEPHLATGLALVRQRVQSFCEQSGFRRTEAAGRALDPRLCRIVGTESRVGVANGTVLSVVRAAILHTDRLVREGEVIVASSMQTAHQGVEGEDERMGN